MLFGLAAGLIVFSSDLIPHTLLINHTSIEVSHSLVREVPFVPWKMFEKLAQRDDEQSLRLSVIGQCIQGDFATAEELILRYVTIASSQQINRMGFWITSWSLQLADRGDEAWADRTMRLQFVLDDEAMACVRMGQLYHLLDRPDEAEQFLAQSLVLWPNADAFIQLGSLYAERGTPLIETDYHEAMRLLDLASQSFESAVRLDPTVFVYANYRLGDIYWKLNRRQDAVRAYRQAAESGGTGHHAFLSWYYLGHIYSAWWNGGLDYDLARSYFEHALAVAATKREQAMSLTGIGATYAAQGREPEAQAVYRRALRSDPTYEPAQKAVDNLDGER